MTIFAEELPYLVTFVSLMVKSDVRRRGSVDENDDIVREFLLEGYEGLTRLERDLSVFGRGPAEKDRLSDMFRVLHTLKGTGGFLGFTRLQGLAHAGENLLGALRDGKLEFQPAMEGLLLETADGLRRMLRTIEETRSEGADADPALLSRLRDFQAGAPAPAPSTKAFPAAPAAGNPDPRPASPRLEEATLRVDVGLLDDLMNMTGELVLARNQLQQFVSLQNNPAFGSLLQPLNHLTHRLQESVMKTRLQPISNLWDRLPSVIREAARSCGKQVRMLTSGSDTEVDKGILEALRDPLTHLLRNCIDHGIEEPGERAAAGKSPEGTLRLRAFHEGGMVHLELSDDGRGVALDKVMQRAVEKELLSPAEAAALPAEKALRFLFLPGFSTADKVTRLSGRGVGLDVVKTNIERIGGRVEVETHAGKGTVFKLKIPLTLAILQALVVGCAGQRFVLPRSSLRELVRAGQGRSALKIEFLHTVPVVRLRGNLLPLAFLDRELGLGRPSTEGNHPIVVLQAGDRIFGLAVDDVLDFQEVVVKPLGRHLKDIPVYSGATLLGDGQAALILDVAGLALGARMVPEGETGPFSQPSPPPDLPAPREMALLFQTPDDGRMVMPMDKVLRLETFHRSAVERAGDLDVIQYEGKVLPLVYVSGVLPERRKVPRRAASLDPGEDDKIQVVVYSEGGRRVGLVVDRVLDILFAGELKAERPAARSGVLGSLVLAGRVTELLDVEGILRTLDPGRKKA